MKISGRKLMEATKGKPVVKKKRKVVDPQLKALRKSWTQTRKQILKKHGMTATAPKTLVAIRQQLKNAKKHM